MGFSRRKREEPRVELTAMIDVVFLLLIFFMISTTFVETPGISVELPQSSSTLETPEPEEIKVYLSREGEIVYEEAPLTLDELRQRLTRDRSEDVQRTLVLYADEQTRHGRVVEVMDAAREAGITSLAIATERDGGRP